jgi:hypothetical protein
MSISNIAENLKAKPDRIRAWVEQGGQDAKT